MKKKTCYAIIGAGNGGMAMAGYLAMCGFTVNLYNRTLEHIIPLIKNPFIKLTGEEEGIGALNIVSDKMEEVIKYADVIMVTVPAIGHFHIAKKMACHLKDGQMIVLNPGRTGGALEVYTTIRKYGCKANIVVAEAQSLIYACRATSANSAHIFKIKKEVTLASIPSNRVLDVIDILSSAYPQFVPANDVIETSLNNYGAIFHPAPTLLNSGHIERGAPFKYYTEGITPSIGRFLEKMDNERMRVAEGLEVNAMSARQWLIDCYGAKGDCLYDTVQNNPAYKGLVSPKGLKIRYIYEDVPYSLVPISSMAKQLNIETPYIDSIIGLAQLITGKDFWNKGRTSAKLGLDGLSVEEIHTFAQTGIKIKESVVVA